VGPLEENTKLSRNLQIGAALHHGDKKIDWCEYLDVSPGVETSPKNPDGLNFRIHPSVHVYFVIMYGYLLDGRMRFWTKCFFLGTYFSFRKKKSESCERNTENTIPYGFELHRPSIKCTKLLYKVTKAIIINCAGLHGKIRSMSVL